jgi:hypothetical protein
VTPEASAARYTEDNYMLLRINRHTMGRTDDVTYLFCRADNAERVRVIAATVLSQPRSTAEDLRKALAGMHVAVLNASNINLQRVINDGDNPNDDGWREVRGPEPAYSGGQVPEYRCRMCDKQYLAGRSNAQSMFDYCSHACERASRTVVSFKTVETGRWDSANPKQSNVSRQETVYLCQKCGHPYKPGNSDATNLNTFCCAGCEQNWFVENKVPPKITAEIPLGTWDMCNMGAVDVKVVEDTVESFRAKVEKSDIHAAQENEKTGQAAIVEGLLTVIKVAGEYEAAHTEEGLRNMQLAELDRRLEEVREWFRGG